MDSLKESFFTSKPTATTRKGSGNMDHCMVYETASGQELLWSGRDMALPDIGDEIVVTMNRIGLAKVLGYFESSGGYDHRFVGVMTKPLHPPPQWLTYQRNFDPDFYPADPRYNEWPHWMQLRLGGIGCEFGAEIAAVTSDVQ